jgi:phosphate transport system substrate-binding protein
LYQPFQANSELPRVSDPDVLINSEWPKLDGATAAYPVFAAVAQSIYKGMNLENVSEYVNCSNTIGAYERLNAGEIDIFFGAQPSNSQLQDAISAGIQYEMTALGHEAFVFFVHKDNPINNLSLEQIRDIYTKRVTNWSDLGGNFEQIIAYQRNADSGSQTIMQSKVMNKEPMAEPLRDEQINFMGRIVDDVAEYRNGTAAIGYSFRFYVTGMKKTEDVKLLAIDGIEPSKENIRNGSYPLTIEFFAITAGNKNPNVSELLIWLQAEQGQQLIEDCGYVGL